MEALHEELGLDDPLLIQYGRWLWNVLHGDFGKTYTSDRSSVAEEVIPRIPTSLKTALITITVVVLIGLPLGVLCAVKQYSPADTLINLICKILGSIPQFLVGLLLLLLFGVKLRLLPTYGFTTWKHAILPVVTSGTTTNRYLRTDHPQFHAGLHPQGLYPYRAEQGRQ